MGWAWLPNPGKPHFQVVSPWAPECVCVCMCVCVHMCMCTHLAMGNKDFQISGLFWDKGIRLELKEHEVFLASHSQFC